MADKKDMDRIFRFILEVDKAKEVKRTGWVLGGIKEPERVGDHIFSTAILSYLMGKKLRLDADRCMKIALLHDIHEVITGDIATPMDRKWSVDIDNKTKKRLETQDSMKMLSYLGESPSKREFRSLIDDWLHSKTKEAKLVHEVDALDFVIQLVHYSKKIKDDVAVKSFLYSGDKRIHTEELRYVYNKVKAQIYKERHWKEG